MTKILAITNQKGGVGKSRDILTALEVFMRFEIVSAFVMGSVIPFLAYMP